ADLHLCDEAFLVTFDGAVQQPQRARMRYQFGHRLVDRHAHQLRSSTSAALLPPNAKELLSTARGGRPSVKPGGTGNSGGNFGSGARHGQFGGNAPLGFSCSTIQQMPASTAPAAPSVWPVECLVELAGTVAPNTCDTAMLSIASFCSVAVPC